MLMPTCRYVYVDIFWYSQESLMFWGTIIVWLVGVELKLVVHWLVLALPKSNL